MTLDADDIRVKLRARLEKFNAINRERGTFALTEVQTEYAVLVLEPEVGDLLSAETLETQQRLNAQYDMISEELIERAEKAEAETQQIREELELLKGNYDRKVDECRDEFRRVTQAEAETQALRALLTRINQWDHMDSAEDGPYWRREIAAALKTPASPRTAEEERGR